MKLNGQKSAIQIGLAQFRAFALTVSVIGLIVITVIATGWQSIDEKVREHCQTEFNKALAPAGLQARIESAKFIEGKGISIGQLEIVDVSDDTLEPIATCKNLLLTNEGANLASLIAGDFKIESIEIDQARIRARRNSNGEWDLAATFRELTRKKNPEFKWIPVIWNNCQVELFVAGNSQPALKLSNIRGSVRPKNDTSDDHRETVAVVRHFGISIGAQTEQGGQLDFQGNLDSESGNWNLQGESTNLLLDREQLATFLPNSVEKVERIDSFRFLTQFKLTAQGQGFKQIPKFKMTGSVINGTIRDRQLPDPIQKVTLQYQVTDDSIFLFNGQATTGLGTAKFNYHQTGLLTRKTWQLFGQLDRVTLHQGLRKLLPENLQKEWDNYSPSGTLDLEYHFWQNGPARIQKKLKANLVNASFEHVDLPFRFQSCVGEVKLDDKACHIDIQALENGQIITINGLLKQPGPNATGHVDVHLSDRLPINEKVLNSLKRFPNIYSLVQDFKPTGHFGVIGKLHRSDPNRPFQADYEVTLFDCSARYRHFDFPFYKINGKVKVVDMNTRFENLTALNGNGTIRCDGTYDSQDGLKLRFNASQVALDEQLRLALPADMQKTWQDVHPKGTINQVTVDLTNPPIGNDVQLVVDARAFGQQGRPSQVSIRPSWFPYDIEHLAGQFHYAKGVLTMRNVSGRHGRGWFQCQGDGFFGETDWKLTLSNLVSGAIRVDQKLLYALPSSIQDAVEQVEFEGNVSVFGTIEFSGQTVVESMATRDSTFAVQPASAVTATNHSTRTRWNLKIGTDAAKLYLGMPVDKLAGAVTLQGASNDTDFYCQGDLKIDSGLFNSVYVSNLSGPVWMDRHRIAFGNRARKQGQKALQPSLSGTLFEGQLKVDGEVRVESNYPFVVMATLNQCNLKAAMGELTTSGNQFRGKGYASVTVYGNSSGTHSLRGQGKIRLREALIEVPLMERLGEVLPRQIDTANLDEGNVDFTIHGEDFDLNRIELIGNKISLIGKGKINMEKEADINFFTVVGRNRINIPLITDLLKMGSQQILLIHVDGNLNDPQIEKEIPALTDSLKLILNDLELLQVPPARQKRQNGPKGWDNR